ncbi:MAG: alkaline phosphatase family protein [Mycobacterium sp.]
MTTVKQICLGVAVAGVVAGAGSALGTAIAYAEPTDSESHSSADAGGTDASGTAEAPSRKSSRSAAEKTSAVAPRDTGAAAEPKIKRPSASTEGTDDAAEGDSGRNPASTAGRKDFRRTSTSAGDSDRESTPTRDEDAVTPDVAPDAPEQITPSVKPPTEPSAEARPTESRPVETAGIETAGVAAPEVLVVAPTRPVRTPSRTPLPTPLAPASVTSVSATSSSTTRRSVTTADVAAQIIDPTTQHVLVIGVDGTNLGRVLDNPGNAGFLKLMNSGTTGASTIVGHTTISNPSWTTILTGVWDNKSGVINNVFTPNTYNTWPTVFNQLEAAYGTDINTKAIADWKVIADIAGAGSHRADEIVFVPQGAGDPLYIDADAAVTDETVKSILGVGEGYEDVPNFLFSYVTGVDEAGHQYGGASPEYAAAVARASANVGLILQAVEDREAASCLAGACEDWTVIMVTDHGHQPQKGFGHGFQSPDETSTFVIVDGPGFADGQQNLKYSIADITPTVVSLFGLEPTVDADGVPLTEHAGSQVDPVDLEQALQDAIDMYGWPDIQTNVALSVRTVFATIPYYVDSFVTSITTELESVAGQGIFLISGLAAVAIIPVQLVGGALYAVTDAVAQLVGRLTGAGVIPPSTVSTLHRDGQPWAYLLVAATGADQGCESASVSRELEARCAV